MAPIMCQPDITAMFLKLLELNRMIKFCVNNKLSDENQFSFIVVVSTDTECDIIVEQTFVLP